MIDIPERGARVHVADHMTETAGTVVGWHKPAVGPLEIRVDLDNGDHWQGLPAWLEALP